MSKVKTAGIESIWPKIYNKLKSPPQGINLGSFPTQLPGMDKIKLDSSQPHPQAYGYVTTEDIDSDGKLDTIHINSPKLSQELSNMGVDINQLSNIDSMDPQQLLPILKVFVELISHEMGHVSDFKPDANNMFPGGEAVADSAAASALNQVSLANNKNNFVKRNSNMNKKASILKELVKLSHELDDAGLSKYADLTDDLINKFSQEFTTPVRHEDIHIAPSGDPYTYSYSVQDDTFTVKTAPAGKEHLVGHSFSKGEPAYTRLISNVNLPAAQPQAPEVGVVSVGGELAQTKLDGYVKLLGTRFVKFKNYVESKGTGFLTLTPGSWGVVRGALNVFCSGHDAVVADPANFYNRKLSEWRELSKVLSQSVSKDDFAKIHGMARSIFVTIKNIADLNSPMQNNAKDHTEEAGGEENVKQASARAEKFTKEDFRDAFDGFRGTTPFGR